MAMLLRWVAGEPRLLAKQQTAGLTATAKQQQGLRSVLSIVKESACGGG